MVAFVYHFVSSRFTVNIFAKQRIHIYLQKFTRAKTSGRMKSTQLYTYTDMFIYAKNKLYAAFSQPTDL